MDHENIDYNIWFHPKMNPQQGLLSMGSMGYIEPMDLWKELLEPIELKVKQDQRSK